MRKRVVGKWTLRWARGPGKQSGVLALCAIAIAALPFIALLRPECRGDLFDCGSSWDQILMLPRIVAMPALLLAPVLAGSWWAQHRHARVDDRYFAALETSDTPERPPGEIDKTPLESDLVKRTLRSTGRGALLGAIGIGALGITPVALRACDPVPTGSGLPVCQGAAGWTDLIMAFQVWGLLAFGLLWALILYTRSTSVRVEGLPEKRRRFRMMRMARS